VGNRHERKKRKDTVKVKRGNPCSLPAEASGNDGMACSHAFKQGLIPAL